MKEPKDGKWYDWNAFVNWASLNNLTSDYDEDWITWWECWKAGYSDAMSRKESRNSTVPGHSRPGTIHKEQ